MEVTARAIAENPVALSDPALVPSVLRGVLCLLCGNGYIVGINQIFDVDTDKINKPFLPIAAGELSKPVAWVLCAAMASSGVTLAKD